MKKKKKHKIKTKPDRKKNNNKKWIPHEKKATNNPRNRIQDNKQLCRFKCTEFSK